MFTSYLTLPKKLTSSYNYLFPLETQISYSISLQSWQFCDNAAEYYTWTSCAFLDTSSISCRSENLIPVGNDMSTPENRKQAETTVFFSWMLSFLLHPREIGVLLSVSVFPSMYSSAFFKESPVTSETPLPRCTWVSDSFSCKSRAMTNIMHGLSGYS